MAKVIKVIWERLIENGKTCPRCKDTETELDEAIKMAQSLLAHKHIKVKLQKRALSLSEFQKNPLISNRILINGKTLEEILNATLGSSPCCDVCGTANCRTIEIEENSYESIPRDLILSAILKSASELLS